MKNEKVQHPSVNNESIESVLDKCYTYARMESDTFPEEYVKIYDKVVSGIEQMICVETVRAVMRLRYRYGHKFTDISRLLGVTYQWVYELHLKGVSLLEKHLSV